MKNITSQLVMGVAVGILAVALSLPALAKTSDVIALRCTLASNGSEVMLASGKSVYITTTLLARENFKKALSQTCRDIADHQACEFFPAQSKLRIVPQYYNEGQIVDGIAIQRSCGGKSPVNEEIFLNGNDKKKIVRNTVFESY